MLKEQLEVSDSVLSKHLKALEEADYIGFNYNLKRHHRNNGGVSQAVFEKQYYEKLSSV